MTNWESSPSSAAFDYPTATAGAMVQALARGEVRAIDLTEAAISRIESLDGKINAVVVRDFERARAAAKAADEALARGERRPLLGVPMTVKEAHHTVGMPTTWGLEAFARWTATVDGVGVTRLKAAGAVIIGKTNVPPNLGDWQSNNPIYGRTGNPHNLDRTPGGSSGGSAAALAAGMVPLELGSDIGGSIRVPAHFCGVFGHKPSWGLVPLAGHTPPGVVGGTDIELAVIGPMSRSANDLALALSVLAGPTGSGAKAWRLDLPSPRGRRIGDFRVLVLDHHPLAAVSREIVSVLHSLADRLANAGAKVERASSRLPDLAAAHGQYMAMLQVLMSLGTPRPEGAPPPMSAEAWIMGLNMREAVRQSWAGLFDDVDVVLAPPFGTTAFPHDDSTPESRTLNIDGARVPYFSQLAWSSIATFPGLPATCVPVGHSAEGLPIGIQIIGPYWEDQTTITFAGMIEQELGRGKP